MKLDKVILGSNPLSGVSHFSSRDGREHLRVTKVDTIIEVINTSLAAGATALTLSPMPALYSALAKMKEESDTGFGIYLILPDMTRLRYAMLNGGTVAVAKEFLFSGGLGQVFSTATKGAWAVLSSDYSQLMAAYVKHEVDRLIDILPKNAEIKCILAHEQVTDLAISLDTRDVVSRFVEVARKKNITPGFVTRNYPALVSYLTSLRFSLHDVVIMTPFNKLGFQMSPSRQSCESTLSNNPDSLTVGISILAGGQLNLDESISYLETLSNLKSVAVGLSKMEHVHETIPKLVELLS